jgi:hypothetical protein
LSREDEMRIVMNFIGCMTKAYRLRTPNWVVVRDILMNRTYTAGRTSCIAKSRELDIDPWGYDLNKKDGGVDG